MDADRGLEDQGATAVLRRLAPGWGWLRENFTLPAVLSLAALLAAGGTWLLEEHLALSSVRARVAQLERAAAARGILEADIARQKQRLDDLVPRVDSDEANWRYVFGVAQEPQKAKSLARHR